MSIFKNLFLGLFLFSVNFSFSQIIGNGASTTQPTVYTDGSTNDAIYIYCIQPGTAPNIGSLTANAPGGVGPWDFEWFQYNTGTNSFDPFFTDNNQPVSSINNLPSGGYSVSITDNTGSVVGCFNTWVFCNETDLDAGTIATSCGGFNLNGTADPIADFVYYNPPPDQFIIDANTQITVCFSANHTYNSDLGFFLTSPSGTTVTLAPNPGTNCNSSNNIAGLCFSTTSASSFDVCSEGGNISGTFGAYGAGAGTPINWSALYGQDAAQAGWIVQIFDCVGADVGALTNATINFVGNSVCGPENILYDSGNINSTINDNSCTQASASSFIVPPSPTITTPIVLANTITSFQWTDDNACVTIPNANSSLNPAIASTPTADTWFYLSATDNFGCQFVDSVQFIRNCPCATNSPFTYLGANLSPVDCAAGTFGIVAGSVQFDDGLAPCTGTLTITTCSGDNVVFNAPFTSPIAFAIPNIVADGTPNCSITAQFSNDPENCTITTNTFTEPNCPCNIDNFTALIGTCSPATNNYNVTGTVEFTNPPGPGGFLTISVDNGTTVYDTIINAVDYASPMNWTISGLDSDGANLTINAVFSLDNACSSTLPPINAPPNCYCSADIGTFNTSMSGTGNTDYVLCFGDIFNYNSNNDFTPPDDVSDPIIAYDPGITYLIYSCPPTPGMTPDTDPITGDPCVEGIITLPAGAINYSDNNDLFYINAFPAGTFTDNIIYYVPITMYNVGLGYYSVAIDPCYELGPAVAVQYLPEIKSIETEDCQAGSISSALIGGLPEINAAEVYNIVPGSLTPANASFVNTSTNFNGTITITGLTNGQAYSYNITDSNGCPVTISGVFIGTEDPSYAYDITSTCQAGADPVATVTGDAGSFSYTATSGGPNLSLNTTTGLIDASASDPGVYDITFTTNDAICFSDSIISITILETPLVNAVANQTICSAANFTAINFTGTAGATFDWTNTNTAIGLGANGTGNIASFIGTNAGNSQISGTITITPTLGTCVGTPINFVLNVDPLDDPAYTYPAYTYCTADPDPTATPTLAGGTYSFTVQSGGPTLVLNTVTGAIDLSASNPGVYDITYTTNGICPQTSVQTMNVAATPTVNAIADQTVCDGADFALIDFTGSAGSAFDWVNDNSAIGLAANGTNDIAIFTSVNGTAAQISATITVTPSAGTCVGPPTSFNLTVDPLDDPAYTYPAYTYCTADPDPTATPTLAGGTYSYTVQSGGPTLILNTVTGAIDLSASNPGVYDITYTTNGVCPQTSVQTMNVAATPTVNAIADQTVCDGSDFVLIDFTGSAGSAFDWVNDNSAIGLAANGTNDIAIFTSVNGTAAQISATITVTPSAGTCVGPPTSFNLTVDPLDDPAYTYPTYTYCTADPDPTATPTLAGGTYSYTVQSGGPTLVLNTVTGAIDLSASNPGVYDITYTTNGVCPQTSVQTMNVAATPTVNAIADQTVCDGADFALIDFTGSAGSAFDWVNDNSAIGLAANGTNDIAIFTSVNGTAAQISATITVTPSAGTCVGPPTSFNLTVDPLDDPAYTYPAYTYCTADTDPIATPTLAGGTYSFSATSGGPNLSINTTTGLIDLSTSNPGVYDITYTTNGICPQSSTQTVTISATPTVNAILDQTVCPLVGDEFSTIFITGSPGTTFNWFNTNTAIGLGAGGTGDIPSFLGTNNTNATISGTITVTPIVGACIGTTTTFTLTVDPVDNPGFNYPAYTYCTADVNPIANIDVPGGVFTYTTVMGGGNIDLNPATGLINFGNSNPGTYDITYTTNNLCPQDSTVTVVINQTPIVNTIQDFVLCEDAIFGDVIFSGTPNSIFDWVNTNTNIGLSANGTGNIIGFTAASSGIQEIATITVTPILGTCIGSDSIFTYTVNPLDNPGFNYPAYNYCTADLPNPSANINALGGNFTYTTTSGGPFLDINTASGLINLSTSNEGVYDITYTTTGICPLDSTITMTINFTPTVNPLIDLTICHDDDFGNVTFSGTGATSYNWVNSNPNIGLAANGTGDIIGFTAVNNTANQITGQITVTPVTATCTGTTTSYNYNVDPLDDPSFQYNTGLTYCQSGLSPACNITGTAGGTFSYVVVSGGPTLSINTTTGDVDLATSEPGSYDVTYTTPLANACPQSFTLTFVITSAPIANFSFDVYCADEMNEFPNYVSDDNGVAFQLPGSGGIWSEPTGGLTINPATGEVDITASTPGTYTITNTINIATCATATYNDDITINPLPTVSLSNSYTLCPGDPFNSIGVTATGSIEPPNIEELYTIIFEFNGVQQPSILNSPSPLNLPDLGVGTYEIVSIHDGLCTSITSESTTVDEYPMPVVDPISNYASCEGDNLLINPFTGSPIGNTYEWSIGNDIGFGTGPSTGNIGSFTAINPSPNPNIVTVTPYSNNTSTASPNGCVGNPVQFEIVINPLPTANISADILNGCEPTTIIFTDNVNDGQLYDWSFGDGTTGNGNPTSHTYQYAGLYDINLTVTSSNGCIATDSEPGYINITPTPVASFSFTPDITDISHTEVTFTNSSIDADYYEWVFGDESPNSNDSDPVHNYPEVPEQYHITLLATNNNGICRDSIDAYITINDVLLYYVPNVFTPDKDEYNETFRPIFTSGFDPFDYHLMIFNRWGEVIFESYNSEIGWDGTYPLDGLLCEDGVYIWKIDFKETSSDKRYNLTGHVTLLK